MLTQQHSITVQETLIPMMEEMTTTAQFKLKQFVSEYKIGPLHKT